MFLYDQNKNYLSLKKHPDNEGKHKNIFFKELFLFFAGLECIETFSIYSGN